MLNMLNCRSILSTTGIFSKAILAAAFLSLPPPALSYSCSRRIELLLKAMAKDHQQLWKDVISVTNGAKAVRTSAEILVEEGRAS